MPDVYAHIICADLVAKNFKLKLDDMEKKLLYFGSQGPDIISFIYPDLSEKMHGYYEDFLKIMLSKSEFLPLYIGYLSHFNLDKMCHPIIESYSDSMEDHLAIEAYLDQVIVKLYWDKDIKDLDLSHYIPYEIPSNIASFISQVIYDIYAFRLPLGFWENALRNYHEIYKEASKGRSNLIKYSENPLSSLEEILGKKDTKCLLLSFRDAVKNTVYALNSTFKLTLFKGVKIKDEKIEF